MANNCYDKTLLQYSGTSQVQRALQALLANYAKIDERTTAQLILFAKNYSAYLNYYDDNDLPVNDWRVFMGTDVSVIIAAIADLKTKDFAPFISYINNEVAEAADEDEAKKYFKTIFDLVFTLVFQLDSSSKRLPADIKYSDFLNAAIISSLTIPFTLLYQYYELFKDAGFIDERSRYVDEHMPVKPVVFAGEFSADNISSFWFNPLLTAPAITLQGIDAKEKINHVLTHNLFTGPLQLFINGVINIISKTPAYLEETLNKYPSHQPHYALYLTFLRLFRFAQDHLNNFTQNHLDFYYKVVLQLNNRNAEPGFVHLLFELQKNTEQYLLSKNTNFKAGKDASGKDIFYATVNDVVLQKTTIQTLQSLYLDKANNIGLYASPDADSDDGQGAKLTSADGSWHAFGYAKEELKAKIGFAVASRVLYLNEGDRTITFTFACTDKLTITEVELAKAFTIRFTAEKDWHTATTYISKVNGSTFSLTVSLSGDAPAIVPYDKAIHGENYNTTLPLAQVLLKDHQFYEVLKAIKIDELITHVTATVKNLNLQNKDGKIDPAKPFKPFGDFPEKSTSLIIGSEEIFQKRLTDLIINIEWQSGGQQAAGSSNPEKEPTKENLSGLAENDIKKTTEKQFGNFGKSLSASFIQLPKELSQRERIELEVQANENIGKVKETDTAGAETKNPDAQTPASSTDFSAPVDLYALSAGKWNTTSLAPPTDIISGSVIATASNLSTIPITKEGFNGNEDYDVQSVSGFIKLQLQTSSYDLATYLKDVQNAFGPTQVTSTTEGLVTTIDIPAPKVAPSPTQLVAHTITAQYSATAKIEFPQNGESDLVNSEAFFYHQEPFGTKEMHGDAITILPAFNLENRNADTGGELWIGLKDAFALEGLSILFQASEGSSNPLKNATQVKWYYLSDNNWLQFDSIAVTDETNNLTRSGIVTFALPKDITKNNTRADASLMWIKLSVDHDTDAVCKLIAVRTNAAKAIFVQDLSKGLEYTSTLPVSGISKPGTPIAAIKKTEQPYVSFGGRLHETDERFYIHVSERLRHKYRAVAAWDYERLVLDYFSQVHKTKCIIHSGFIASKSDSSLKYSEMLPGHVTIVVVPDLKNNLSSNILRPYTSLGLIEEIRQYLEKLTSPFVKLHVVNPQFEEVQFEFEVNFLPEIKDAEIYRKLLSDDIEQFLTPWAYESGRDIEFGGRIEKSVVLNFVEERPYVDFVTNFKMHQFIRNENNEIEVSKYNIEEAVASTARSILVSYLQEDNRTSVITKHNIQPQAKCD